MREHMAKYDAASRKETNRSIDAPMILLLGFTLGDIVAAAAGFLLLAFTWDSGLAFPVGVLIAAALASLSKLYREQFPRHFLLHWAWSLGLVSTPRVPNLFRKRRFVTFGP
jgi:hypothetical protein